MAETRSLISGEAEESVIAALIHKPEAVAEILATMTVDDFVLSENRGAFSTAGSLYASGSPIDLVTMATWMRKGGIETGGLQRIMEAFSGNYKAHIKELKDLTKRRKLVALLDESMQRLTGPSDVDEILSSLLSASLDVSSTKANRPVLLEQAVSMAMRRIEEAMATKDTMTGIPTGFSGFDDEVGGIQIGEQLILGGPPSLGKSAMLFWIAMGAAAKGIGSIIVNAEMRAIDVATRALAAKSSVPNYRLRRGSISDQEVRLVVGATGRLQGLPIWIYDEHNWDKARTQVRASKMADPNLKLLLIDYLQKIKCRRFPGEKRYEQVGRMSSEAKELANELGLANVIACQLSREGRKENKEPELHDLRESGDIEQDADIVTFLHKYDKGDQPVYWLVKKNRNGPLISVKLRYIPDSVRFCDWVDDDRDPWNE